MIDRTLFDQASQEFYNEVSMILIEQVCEAVDVYRRLGHSKEMVLKMIVASVDEVFNSLPDGDEMHPSDQSALAAALVENFKRRVPSSLARSS